MEKIQSTSTKSLLHRTSLRLLVVFLRERSNIDVPEVSDICLKAFPCSDLIFPLSFVSLPIGIHCSSPPSHQIDFR
jgi:hypothetical protein